MGAFCESGLVIAVVTIATVGGRGGRIEPGRVGVAAAFSTRGRVFVVRTGVTVRVCGGRIAAMRQTRGRRVSHVDVSTDAASSTQLDSPPTKSAQGVVI